MKKLKERANTCIDQGGSILNSKNSLGPCKKLSMFYNSCLKHSGRIVYVSVGSGKEGAHEHW
jgi:hypothetical protein